MMPKGGTPPLVPMWPQPHVRVENLNPYPFFPFNPQWGEGLAIGDFDTFCVLLRLAWASPRPCYLPGDDETLCKMLKVQRGSDDAIPSRVLELFTVDSRTGLRYFAPQMKALERLVRGENIYALLWDDTDPGL